MLGNFPQAFSHVGLINSVLNLHRHRGPARSRASHEISASEAGVLGPTITVGGFPPALQNSSETTPQIWFTWVQDYARVCDGPSQRDFATSAITARKPLTIWVSQAKLILSGVSARV